MSNKKMTFDEIPLSLAERFRNAFRAWQEEDGWDNVAFDELLAASEAVCNLVEVYAVPEFVPDFSEDNEPDEPLTGELKS